MPNVLDRERYSSFIEGKASVAPATGFAPDDLPTYLAPFQRDLVAWALRRGRAALFADTGLGKTRMQLAWAANVNRHLVQSAQGSRVLIFAPLAVAAQTVREGAAIGVDVHYCRSQGSVREGITIANYDVLDAFAPDAFAAVVLDESSILKNFAGATRTAIIERFRNTRYKLAATATPSPNDFTELGNHAEFLGIMSRAEMLASYFVHDGGSTQEWRIKGHARDAFWRWVCSWGAMVKKPSALGYSDEGYDLPPLEIFPHTIASTPEQARAQGLLFAEAAKTLNEQRAARRASLDARVRVAASLANGSSEPWVLWCDLNDESKALAKAIPSAAELTGSDSAERKEQVLDAFARGEVRVLVTKPSIAGFGMNWQHCARTAFVGVGHSHEKFYQAVRRFWRFGQKRSVHVHVITSELEGAIVDNLKRKEEDAARMAAEMSAHTEATVRAMVRGAARETISYEPREPMLLPAWLEES